LKYYHKGEPTLYLQNIPQADVCCQNKLFKMLNRTYKPLKEPAKTRLHSHCTSQQLQVQEKGKYGHQYLAQNDKIEHRNLKDPLVVAPRIRGDIIS